jgi:glycosyltransferase involved in cell wall biosynthesis
MPDVSVIIPCYNQGHYIHDAIESVLAQSCRDFEIIVVNDGSTDPGTVAALQGLDNPKISVIHTDNQGLASARNNGIKQARAPIILPLDADDKIAPTYMEKALRVLRDDPGVGVVYCNVRFFGEKRGTLVLPEFSLVRLLFENLIFCSAFFYRKDWEAVNGFNPNMEYGCEDRDFWMSIVSLGRKVHRLPEFLFYYRTRKDSMWHSISREKKIEMDARAFLNHQDIYREHAVEFFAEINRLQYHADTSLLRQLLFDKLLHPRELFLNLLRRLRVYPRT